TPIKVIINTNEARYISEQGLREGKYKLDNENIIYVEEELVIFSIYKKLKNI
ncbi:hypothetical protein PFDG_05335, partial [Plasmodium falciparum Dd2]